MELPDVDLWLSFDRQLPSLFPRATTYETTPPVPFPRASPPMSKNVVPARRDGVHVNPVPVFPVGSVVIDPSGITYDWPPGMIPRKLGVLRKKEEMLHTKQIRGPWSNVPLYFCRVPRYPQILALHNLISIRRGVEEERKRCTGCFTEARVVARAAYHYGSAGSSGRKTRGIADLKIQDLFSYLERQSSRKLDRTLKRRMKQKYIRKKFIIRGDTHDSNKLRIYWIREYEFDLALAVGEWDIQYRASIDVIREWAGPERSNKDMKGWCTVIAGNSDVKLSTLTRSVLERPCVCICATEGECYQVEIFTK